MHDHLFVLIHFSNGHRSGVSANMTVNEFLQYKKIDGVYQIRVVNHKNFHVSLQPKELNWLHIYFTKIRPQVNPKCDNIMLSRTGNFMRSGAISKQLHSLWVKAGLFKGKTIPKNLCMNIVRKSTSTGVREVNTVHYQEVADVMSHSLNTAEKHYHLREKQHSAPVASNIIRKYFGTHAEVSTESLTADVKGESNLPYWSVFVLFVAEWVESVSNHFWWSLSRSKTNSAELVERFLSIVHHVINKHHWPGRRYLFQKMRA